MTCFLCNSETKIVITKNQEYRRYQNNLTNNSKDTVRNMNTVY